MALPGPYSGVSTLAFVARASALTLGFVYGGVKLSYLQTLTESVWVRLVRTRTYRDVWLQAKAKSQRKAEEKKAHH